MALFDKSLFYVTNPTTNERRQIAQVVSTKKTNTALQIANYATNIAIPLAVCAITGCNLIAAALAFILTDLVLCAIDHYVIVIKPHEELRGCLLSTAQKNLQEKMQRRNALSREMAENEKKCANCFEDCEKCNVERLKNEIEALETFIRYELDWVEQKLTPIKEEEIKEVQRPAKDYTDKKEYFETMQAKIEYFITNHNYELLKPVLTSISSLVETLDNRPDGYDMIPSTLYVYIDELSNVLSKMAALDKERANGYMDELNRVAIALSQNIDRLVERIRNAETSDIEVSLDVLIKELEGEVS